MVTKIDDIATLIPGINQSRIKIDENDVFYDQTMFELDMKNIFQYVPKDMDVPIDHNLYLTEGDVIISNSVQLATIVGGNDARRIITTNFIKVDLDERIDKRYFVYLYNFNQKVQRQKERSAQAMGLVQRLTIKSISEIEIPIISMDKQLMIGKSYQKMLKIQEKTRRYSDLIEKMTYEILEGNLEDN